MTGAIGNDWKLVKWGLPSFLFSSVGNLEPLCARETETVHLELHPVRSIVNASKLLTYWARRTGQGVL